MKVYYVVLLFFITITRFIRGEVDEDVLDENLEKSNDFDELKFTQIWGYSSCLQFKEQVENLTCRYENRPSIFSIHGIWPTETGTSGPNFCTKVKFDEELIDPIKDSLSLYWYEMNAKKEPMGFWSHEWVKHGSCAKALPVFGDEFKYFKGGLDLRKKYDLYSILKDGGIIPQKNDKGYSLDEIRAALKKGLGSQSYIQCLHTKKGEVYLLAIEICMNRDLETIDCSTHTSRHLELESVLPCPPNHNILYSDNIPNREEL